MPPTTTTQTPLRLLHTADVQLGMPFLQVPGDRGARLRERRIDVLERIAEVAKARAVELVLVAGDFFDANTVEDRVVALTCHRLRGFPCPVLVLPGNHDHSGTPDSVYKRASFRDAVPSNVKVLDSADPLVLLDGKVVVLPAPLLRRRALGDTTSHLTPELGRDLAPGAFRIGLAHGGIVDFDGEEGGAENLIAPDRAEKAGLDFLALGDWHGTKRVTDRTWYAGAPEPTNFKENDQGNVLVVELDAPGALPKVEKVRVGRTRWLKHAARVDTADDVDTLERWLAALPDAPDTLAEVTLDGTLPLVEIDRLEKVLANAGHLLLDLRRKGHVVPVASDADLEGIQAEGWVRSAVDRLRDRAKASDGETAARALQLLWRLHRTEGETR